MSNKVDSKKVTVSTLYNLGVQQSDRTPLEYGKRTNSNLQLKDLAWMQRFGDYSLYTKANDLIRTQSRLCRTATKFGFNGSNSVKDKKRSTHLLNQGAGSLGLTSSLQTWIPFCDQSSIHGLRYAFGAGPRHKLTRFCWTVLFFGMCGLCLYFCADGIRKYSQFRVKTRTFFEHSGDTVFPAITFSNENVFLKSAVQSSRSLIEGVSTFVADSAEEYFETLPIIISMCYNPNAKSNFTEWFNKGYAFFEDYGFTNAMKLLTPDSLYSIKQCWWLNERVPCDRMFLNHATDYGWSFTFNPSTAILRDSYNKDTYGLEMTPDYEPRTIRYVGPTNGLRMLVNVGQDDYCITRRNAGAGLRVMVHDPDLQPLFFMNHPFLVSPGYYTNVAIRMTNVVRYTEHLGQCVTFQKLPLYPDAEAYYKEACYLDCFTQFAYDQCGCFPFYGPPDVVKTGHLLKALRNLPENESVKACFGLEFICMRSLWKRFMSAVTDAHCELCYEPCTDTLYSLEISHQYFPSENSWAVLEKIFGINATLTEWRRNYLMINFHLESLDVISIEESQEMTVFDLFSSIGGVLGLFLGMSILSFGELFNQLGVFFATCFWHRFNAH